MIRQASRCLFRPPLDPVRSSLTRRFLSTTPPARKSRSWKSSAARWGLAVGAVYYYNTSTLFAEEPPFSIPPPSGPSEETSLQTLESVTPSNRQKDRLTKTASSRPEWPTPSPTTSATAEPSLASTEKESSQDGPTSSPTTAATAEPSPASTEEESSQEGAFNEETGEFNWDCPCLGGMAHGPCGEQFRGAFSCFVFSKEEPKGMDCIEHFKTMQDCFRQHPDIYGAELEDDGDETAPEESATPTSPSSTADGQSRPPNATSGAPESQSALAPAQSSSPDPSSPTSPESVPKRAKAAAEQVQKEHGEPTSESDELVPKAAHDATSSNGAR